MHQHLAMFTRIGYRIWTPHGCCQQLLNFNDIRNTRSTTCKTQEV